MQQLADIATKRWGKKLSSDKLKNLLDKYKRPENCVNIKATTVNPEIWNQLNPKKRKVDLQLSNIQQVVRKVATKLPRLKVATSLRRGESLLILQHGKILLMIV